MRKAAAQHRDLTLHQMRCFIALSEAGSISRAAARLGISQSAMSRILAQIEEITGARLAGRTHHGLQLTEQGQLLNLAGRTILQTHETMRSDMDALSGQVRGSCRVAMPESTGRVLFLPLVLSVKEEHPDAVLRVMAAFSAAMPEMLLAGQLDLAIVTDTHSHAGLNIELLAEEAFMLIARPDDPVTGSEVIHLDRLADLPLILTAWSGGIRLPIDTAFQAARARPDIRLEIDSNPAIIDLVMAGEGYSILPYSAVHREVEAGMLKARKIASPAIIRRLYLATPANRPVSALSCRVLKKIRTLARAAEHQGGWSVTKP